VARLRNSGTCEKGSGIFFKEPVTGTDLSGKFLKTRENFSGKTGKNPENISRKFRSHFSCS
jgi:hypothetical protein